VRAACLSMRARQHASQGGFMKLLAVRPGGPMYTRAFVRREPPAPRARPAATCASSNAIET